MKSVYLLIAAAGAMAGGCAERQSPIAVPDGQMHGLAHEAPGGIDPSIRHGSPSGRYGRPSSGGVVSAKPAASDVR